jgi:hypothetical protein
VSGAPGSGVQNFYYQVILDDSPAGARQSFIDSMIEAAWLAPWA